MKFYQEITLIDQAEISPYFIWSKAYMQLHLAFVEQKNSDERISFGVSFPQYQFDLDNKKIGLGGKLRIFASSKSELETLDIRKWFNRLEDYLHITSIRDVPSKVLGYSTYRYQRPKGESRLQKDIKKHAQYWSKKHNISYEEALKRYKNRKTKPVNLPYIQMESLEREQRFKMFIEKTSVIEPSSLGSFTTYGLSSGKVRSTVPEFD